jgi:hypothetical protein
VILMEDTAKNIVFVRVEKYDPLTGVFTRTNDVVNTTGRTASSTLVASSTNGANTDLYPYILHVGSTSTQTVVALMAGTTTLGIYDTGDIMYRDIISTPEAPLGVCPASSTLSVITISTPAAGATVNVTVVSKRVPINGKI